MPERGTREPAPAAHGGGATASAPDEPQRLDLEPGLPARGTELQDQLRLAQDLGDLELEGDRLPGRGALEPRAARGAGDAEARAGPLRVLARDDVLRGHVRLQGVAALAQ